MKYFTLFAIIFYLTLLSCDNKAMVGDCGKFSNVCVTVVNKSGRDIKKLIITHRNKSDIMDSFKNKSEAKIGFESAGESTYRVIAVYENGDTLNSGDNYVESGYKVTSVITKDSIKTSYNIGY